jgi:hypothetical protein
MKIKNKGFPEPSRAKKGDRMLKNWGKKPVNRESGIWIRWSYPVHTKKTGQAKAGLRPLNGCR